MKSHKDGKWGPSLLGLGAAVLAGAVSAPELASAQTQSPSQTPPGPNASQPSPEARFTFPPAQGLVAPQGAENIQFALTGFDIDGQFDEVRPRSAALEADLVGKTVSVAQVYAFAAQLQQLYFAAGYPLARVVVPPQELGADGRVKLRVIDGFVENIDVSQLPKRMQGRVRLVLTPLIGHPHVTRAQLERQLLIAGETAGLSLHTTLTPGNQTGATVLVMSGEHSFVDAVAAIDNRAAKELGRAQVTTSVAANSLFGAGERIYATYAGAPEDQMFSDNAQRRYYAAGIVLPLGPKGLRFIASYDYSSTHPRAGIAWQKLEAEYSRVSLGFDYPLVRSRAANVRVSGTLDIAEDRQSTAILGPDITLSLDEIRALRIGVSGDATLRGDSVLSYNATFSRGLAGLSARTADEATPLKPLSRAGADAVFSALEMDASYAVPFGQTSALVLSARGQTSFGDPLLRSEQFSPSGWDGLSGPPPGLMVGDTGGVARAQLQRTWANEQSSVTPYVFAYSAEVHLEEPSALEFDHTSASGAGLGVRFNVGGRSASDHAYSFVIEVSNLNSNDPQLDRNWASVGFVTRF